MDYMFKPITNCDLPEIRALQPGDWPDITPVVAWYVQSSFCRPIKFCTQNQIAGIGASICLGKTAWIAHVIVHPDQRRKGIGQAIVERLLHDLKTERVQTISLIATGAGKTVYEKSGFKTTTQYVFMNKGTQDTSPLGSQATVPFRGEFAEQVSFLDWNATGETREEILRSALTSSRLLIQHGQVSGYFMPGLGEGLVVARDRDSGIALLNERIRYSGRVVFPAGNSHAIDTLSRSGFTEEKRLFRMHYGKPLLFRPEMVFSRIGGHLG